MEFGLIGEKLGHSYSPELHRFLGGYDYALQELRADEVEAFLRRRSFRGINVTIPYKQTVIPFLDGISEKARRIGAVNTIVNRGGKLYGDNTDYDGMAALLRRFGISPAGKRVLILGTGGTSKTASALMEDGHAAECICVSRRSSTSAVSYAEAGSLYGGAQLLVNTTPVGMFPNECAVPLDLSAFPKLTGVVDVVYHPLRTELVLNARARGIPAVGGLYMLAAQASAASARFLGRANAPDAADRAYEFLLCSRQNIVLIGMPTCGKTTVGKRLSLLTGRYFRDSDELLSARLGSVSDYLHQNGEATFRAEERKLIAELSRESGIILSTGGGTVLDADNVRSLQRNGTLVFLDRAPELLKPLPDRPLSDTPEKLRAMYEARRPIYLRAADHVVSADAAPDSVAELVQKELNL